MCCNIFLLLLQTVVVVVLKLEILTGFTRHIVMLENRVGYLRPIILRSLVSLCVSNWSGL